MYGVLSLQKLLHWFMLLDISIIIMYKPSVLKHSLTVFSSAWPDTCNSISVSGAVHSCFYRTLRQFPTKNLASGGKSMPDSA